MGPHCRQIRKPVREREKELKTLANMQRGSNFAGTGNSTIGLSHTNTQTHTQTDSESDAVDWQLGHRCKLEICQKNKQLLS